MCLQVPESQSGQRTVDFPRLWPVVEQEGQHAAVGHAVSYYARLLKKLHNCVRGSSHMCNQRYTRGVASPHAPHPV